MNAARENEFADARRDLRGSKQRADRHDGRRIEPGAAEDREQVRREARRHKGIGRERRSHGHEGPALRRQDGARRPRGAVRLRPRIGTPSRQREGMQRRRHQREQCCVDQICAAPADVLDQHMSDRPAHRRG